MKRVCSRVKVKIQSTEASLYIYDTPLTGINVIVSFRYCCCKAVAFTTKRNWSHCCFIVFTLFLFNITDRTTTDQSDFTVTSPILSMNRGILACGSTWRRHTSSTSTYHSTDLLTACGVAHLVVHGISGSTSYETIPPIRLESSGGVLSTVDMVVQWRDGHCWLCDRDNDDDYI